MVENFVDRNLKNNYIDELEETTSINCLDNSCVFAKQKRLKIYI